MSVLASRNPKKARTLVKRMVIHDTVLIMKSPILKLAALNALSTALYIALVASLFFYLSHGFGKNTADTVLIPFSMLLLFVLSASITGSLVLGRPILWYLDGKKKDAVSLLIATVGCLFLLTLFAFSMLAIFAK